MTTTFFDRTRWNPLFDDIVYTGYFVKDPAAKPDFTLPKPLIEMTPAELTQWQKIFAKRQVEALQKEKDLFLSNMHVRDEEHADLIIALHRGDEYFAEELFQRDNGDPARKAFVNRRFLVASRATHHRLSRTLAVLVTIPDPVKVALLHGDFSTQLLDPSTGRPMLGQLPRTPDPSSAKPSVPGGYEPTQYGLQLVFPDGRHPTMDQLRQVMDCAEDYISDIHTPPTGVKIRPWRPPRTVPEMQNIIDIECRRKDKSGKSLPSALTRDSYRKQLADGVTKFDCLYAETTTQLESIRDVITQTRKWMQKLEDDGYDTQTPLPWTLTGVGWTHSPAIRHYQYKRHHVGKNIVIFDAIGRALGLSYQWTALWDVWHSDLAEHGEHDLSILCGSYASMNGVNGYPAGLNNTSKAAVVKKTWNCLAGKLTNSAHFSQQFRAIDGRITNTAVNLAAVKPTLALLRVVSKKEAENAQLKEEEDDLLVNAAARFSDFDESWLERVKLQAQWLSEYKAREKERNELRDLCTGIERALYDNGLQHLMDSDFGTDTPGDEIEIPRTSSPPEMTPTRERLDQMPPSSSIANTYPDISSSSSDSSSGNPLGNQAPVGNRQWVFDSVVDSEYHDGDLVVHVVWKDANSDETRHDWMSPEDFEEDEDATELIRQFFRDNPNKPRP